MSRPRKNQRINDQQKKELVDFMVANPTFAKSGICDGAGGAEKASQLWLDIAQSLNAAGPAQKKVKGWKQTWNDLRGRVKAKAAEIFSTATANLPTKQTFAMFTPVEAAIFQLYGGKEWIGAPANEEFGAPILATDKDKKNNELEPEVILTLPNWQEESTKLQSVFKESPDKYVKECADMKNATEEDTAAYSSLAEAVNRNTIAVTVSTKLITEALSSSTTALENVTTALIDVSSALKTLSANFYTPGNLANTL